MSLTVLPVDFKDSINGIIPLDASLYSRVMQYCAENFAEMPDLTKYAKTIAVVVVGDNGEVIEVHGVSFERMVHDISGFRVSGRFARQATALLHDRWQGFFADRGWRGEDVMIWLDTDESPEAKCENQAGSVQAFNLRPSKRMLVKVR